MGKTSNLLLTVTASLILVSILIILRQTCEIRCVDKRMKFLMVPSLGFASLSRRSWFPNFDRQLNILWSFASILLLNKKRSNRKTQLQHSDTRSCVAKLVSLKLVAPCFVPVTRNVLHLINGKGRHHHRNSHA